MKAILIVCALIIVCVLLAWKFWYGVPFSDFGDGATVRSVRSLEEARWAHAETKNPTILVVGTSSFALAGYVGDAGISLTLYQGFSTGWKSVSTAVTADACDLISRGVPRSEADFLSEHMYRALPTIPFHASCADRRFRGEPGKR